VYISTNNKLLKVKSIRRKLKLDKLIGFGNHIVGLYNNSFYSSELVIYNEQLELIATRYFLHNINLYSMNNTEIVCYSSKFKSYLIFDLNLNQVLSFGQETDDCKSWFTGDTISPIQLSDNFVMIFLSNFQPLLFDSTKTTDLDSKILMYSNDFNFNIRTIKLLSKKSGIEYTRFKLNDCNEYLTKLDTYSNILQLTNGCNKLLRCYDKDGHLLVENSSICLKNFTEINLTSQNEIYFFNLRTKKIYYL
jgi:hypothetical protein